MWGWPHSLYKTHKYNAKYQVITHLDRGSSRVVGDISSVQLSLLQDAIATVGKRCELCYTARFATAMELCLTTPLDLVFEVIGAKQRFFNLHADAPLRSREDDLLPLGLQVVSSIAN